MVELSRVDRCWFSRFMLVCLSRLLKHRSAGREEGVLESARLPSSYLPYLTFGLTIRTSPTSLSNHAHFRHVLLRSTFLHCIVALLYAPHLIPASPTTAELHSSPRYLPSSIHLSLVPCSMSQLICPLLREHQWIPCLNPSCQPRHPRRRRRPYPRGRRPSRSRGRGRPCWSDLRWHRPEPVVARQFRALSERKVRRDRTLTPWVRFSPCSSALSEAPLPSRGIVEIDLGSGD